MSRMCGHLQVDHFFEVPALLWFSCVYTHAKGLTLMVMSAGFVVVPLILILSSYSALVWTVLRMQSTTPL